MLYVQENKDEVLEGRGLAEEPQGIQKQNAGKTKWEFSGEEMEECAKEKNKKRGGSNLVEI